MKTKKKVLIVEDEPEVLQLIKRRLEAHDFICEGAENPVLGLKKAVKIKPGLILLDLMLPQMSGLGFLRIIKGNPDLAHIPVVVLTALAEKEIADEAMDLGAVAYLTKGCSPHEMLSVIEAYTS